MDSIFDKIYQFEEADKAREQNIYPYFRIIESEQDTEVKMNGQDLLMLGSNSYLGLTNHPHVIKRAKDAVEKYGTGCAGSRFLNGTLDIHLELEKKLADLVGKESSLVFATGYQANVGAISALASDRKDVIITDKLDHASILDGVGLAAGRFARYKHSDMEHLETKLKKYKDKPKIIITDGIFSMDGDIAKLDKISYLAKKYGAGIYVDDAHSIGVLNEDGGGTAKYFGLEDEVDVIMGTFSKSLASVGGFVAADEKVVDYIKHNARSLIFSASLPPGSAGSVLGALEVMEREPERIEKLWENTEYMLKNFQDMGYNTGDAETPIIPLIIGDQTKTFQLWKLLQKNGIFINPSVPPAVPVGYSLIRTSFMSTHTKEQLDFALKQFKEAGETLGII
ncbi:MAG: pyridoxal phosphate-dependent aminotransferase family protein [Candidatus Mcinerneyibacterium aminivorans]|uniref:Pyridoxal phosphate-dependent aminotransferase family protein n=1 Tax=Candidatus Mcinerneyibacterium aminivorans TaxID=2703815 RepID=A0A5D0MHB7_9BACT|nr:MAG: pyridoxal phosphate-dependent aminotransferase family protein [Candidatus Mcinerneyibacterium aminivorans]